MLLCSVRCRWSLRPCQGRLSRRSLPPRSLPARCPLCPQLLPRPLRLPRLRPSLLHQRPRLPQGWSQVCLQFTAPDTVLHCEATFHSHMATACRIRGACVPQLVTGLPLSNTKLCILSHLNLLALQLLVGLPSAREGPSDCDSAKRVPKSNSCRRAVIQGKAHRMLGPLIGTMGKSLIST